MSMPTASSPTSTHGVPVILVSTNSAELGILSGVKGSVDRDMTSSMMEAAKLATSEGSGVSNTNASDASEEISSATSDLTSDAAEGIAVTSDVVATSDDKVVASSPGEVVSESSIVVRLDGKVEAEDRWLGLGSGRYLTHQKASQRPLSITRFLTMYATTSRKNARDESMSNRSSQSAFSSDTMRFLDVVRRDPNEVYKSDVVVMVRVDSSTC